MSNSQQRQIAAAIDPDPPSQRQRASGKDAKEWAATAERICAARLVLLPWETVESRAPDRKPRLHADVLRFVAASSDRIVLLSNESTRLPHDIARTLQRHGIALPPERILPAGHQTLTHLQQRAPGHRLL